MHPQDMETTCDSENPNPLHMLCQLPQQQIKMLLGIYRKEKHITLLSFNVLLGVKDKVLCSFPLINYGSTSTLKWMYHHRWHQTEWRGERYVSHLPFTPRGFHMERISTFYSVSYSL